MIYIKKTKNKQFRVVVTGDNGEPLSVTETLKTTQSAWKNIKSQMYQFGGLGCYVEDLTVKPTVTYKLHESGFKEVKYDLSFKKVQVKASETNSVANSK